LGPGIRRSAEWLLTVVHAVVGSLVLVLATASAAWGAWCWRTDRPSPRFWTLVRATQVVIVVQVLLGGLLLATGHEPPELHLIYGILPLAVSFIAEQLRIASAETVLDHLELEDAQAVGRLPEAQQRAVVLAIVRRETGVMALASLTIALLALRAGATSGLF
jgi:F0F1-type ATP synthase assembly protein I